MLFRISLFGGVFFTGLLVLYWAFRAYHFPAEVLVGYLLVVSGLVYLRLYQAYRKVSALSVEAARMAEGSYGEFAVPRGVGPEFEALYASLLTVSRTSMRATDFVHRIEQGDLNDDSLSGEARRSVLGQALIHMRDQMREVAQKEKDRNWVNEGLAKFAILLRQQLSESELTLQCLRELVKYMGANQGGLFVVRQEAHQEYLELAACYAYDRPKYGKKRFMSGEGLIGQVLREKDTVYLTEVPESFVEIASGLGHARPRCVVILPLKTADQVVGVLELASFRVWAPHEMEFLQRLSETIGVTLAVASTAQRTSELLVQAQSQGEALRAQEEELRQNMEEMEATQEELHRKSHELEMKSEEIERIRRQEKQLAEQQIKAQSDMMVSQLARVETIRQAAQAASQQAEEEKKQRLQAQELVGEYQKFLTELQFQQQSGLPVDDLMDSLPALLALTAHELETPR